MTTALPSLNMRSPQIECRRSDATAAIHHADSAPSKPSTRHSGHLLSPERRAPGGGQRRRAAAVLPLPLDGRPSAVGRACGDAHAQLRPAPTQGHLRERRLRLPRPGTSRGQRRPMDPYPVKRSPGIPLGGIWFSLGGSPDPGPHWTEVGMMAMDHSTHHAGPARDLAADRHDAEPHGRRRAWRVLAHGGQGDTALPDGLRDRRDPRDGRRHRPVVGQRSDHGSGDRARFRVRLLVHLVRGPPVAWTSRPRSRWP